MKSSVKFSVRSLLSAFALTSLLAVTNSYAYTSSSYQSAATNYTTRLTTPTVNPKGYYYPYRGSFIATTMGRSFYRYPYQPYYNSPYFRGIEYRSYSTRNYGYQFRPYYTRGYFYRPYYYVNNALLHKLHHSTIIRPLMVTPAHYIYYASSDSEYAGTTMYYVCVNRENTCSINSLPCNAVNERMYSSHPQLFTARDDLRTCQQR